MTTVGSPYAGLQVLVPEETRGATSSCGPPSTPAIGQLLAGEETTAVAGVGCEPLQARVRLFVGNGTVDCKARKDSDEWNVFTGYGVPQESRLMHV